MEKLRIISEFHLERVLDAYGVDTKLYGTGDKKDLEDLFVEINSGESDLFEIEDGSLLRVIRTVNLFLFHKKNNNEFEFLREREQIFSDGRVKIRNLIPSLSEKRKFDEDPILALQRGIHEELGISIDPGQLMVLPSREEIKQSKSYLLNTKNYLG